MKTVAEAVANYYDDRVDGKLADFTGLNSRIEAAVELIARWSPVAPRRVLEIGCGIGATAWRMARAWPDAEVIGADISPVSIDVAGTCFSRPNLRYVATTVRPGVLKGEFDLIVLMDTYEHIAIADRPELHETLRSLLSPESRLVITVPSPETQRRARTVGGSALQPVDEDVTIGDVAAMGAAVNGRVLLYREVGIWEYGDYLHAVIGRTRLDKPVTRRRNAGGGLIGLVERARSALVPRRALADEHYLGPDVLSQPSLRDTTAFAVPMSERRERAASWLSRPPRGQGDSAS